MKPTDVEKHTFIDSGEKSNYKYPIFIVGDHVRISKYKNRYTPNWSEVSAITKVKNTVPWTFVINDLNSEEIV